jgi:hypothetical protein
MQVIKYSTVAVDMGFSGLIKVFIHSPLFFLKLFSLWNYLECAA